MNNAVAEKSRLFQKIDNPLVTYELLALMGRQVFMPGDRLTNEGEIEAVLYIILNGSVQVLCLGQ
jgi:hypothetical protein